MRNAIGLVIGGGDGGFLDPVTDIDADSNIVITFSEAVQPATVTNTSPASDGTGSFELYNDTQAAWVNGVLSTSDNIQWTFNPTNDFALDDQLTLHLKNTILTVVGSNPYAGPFEFKYLVTTAPPAFSPSDLWLASEEGDYWYNDPTTMFQSSGGTGAVSADTDPVAYWAGQENGINFTQAYDVDKRPLYRNNGSDPRIYFDGAVDEAGTGLGCPRLFTDDEWTSLIRVRVNSQLTENAAHVIMAQATGNADAGRSSFAQLTYAATDKQNPTTFCNDGSSSFVSTSVVDVNDAAYHTIIAHRTSGSQSTQVDSGSPEDVETPAAFTPVDSVVSLGGTQRTISQVIGFTGGNNTNMDVVGIIEIGRTLTSQELSDSIAWLEAL